MWRKGHKSPKSGPKPRSRTRLRIPQSDVSSSCILAYPLWSSIACGTQLQDNKVVLVHHCVRAPKYTSPVHLDLLGKLVRGIASQDSPANQLPSPMLPSLSLCRRHPPTSTKDGLTRWPPIVTVLVIELSQVQYAVQLSVQRGVQITLVFFPEMRQVEKEPALIIWLKGRAHSC